MKEILTSFLLICLFLSCAKSQDGLIESQYGKAISFEKEEINIPIDDKTLTSYQVISCFQENENNLVYAYNSPMHSLDIFNLNDQSISHLPLNKEGENGILKMYPDYMFIKKTAYGFTARDSCIWLTTKEK